MDGFFRQVHHKYASVAVAEFAEYLPVCPEWEMVMHRCYMAPEYLPNIDPFDRWKV